MQEPAAPVSFRAIRASDLALLRAFVRNLSRDTAYKRLLSVRMPTEEELVRWTAIGWPSGTHWAFAPSASRMPSPRRSPSTLP
jgi:hypothetical protein